MFTKIFISSSAVAAALAIPMTASDAVARSASQWSIGPVIKGRNYSINMSPAMLETQDGPAFDFPYPSALNGHVHYVTKPVRSLKGATRITLRYRIDAAAGTRFFEQEAPQGPGTLSLYFQRAGDSWAVRTPNHRWYSPNARVMPLRPGTHTISISLDEPWIAMMGGDANTLPQAFEVAVNEAVYVGFTFGGGSGRGHGAYATAPARFTVLDFRID